jgi:hypothetical protein
VKDERTSKGRTKHKAECKVTRKKGSRVEKAGEKMSPAFNDEIRNQIGQTPRRRGEIKRQKHGTTKQEKRSRGEIRFKDSGR